MPVVEYTRELLHNNHRVEYIVRKTSRAKRYSITVHPGPRIIATAPFRASQKGVQRFVQHHADWVVHAASSIAQQPLITPFGKTRKEYEYWKETARTAITQAVKEINKHYEFSYNRISIRNQKSCWGSCSNKQNLNFNYRLLFMPDELLRYVVAHELCHLEYLNHSQQFWQRVEETVPQYKQLRKKLNGIE